jgi:hypothetical protein
LSARNNPGIVTRLLQEEIDKGFIRGPLGIATHKCLSVRPAVRPRYYQWQKFDIWSQASYRYAILWAAFLDPSDSYFLFADLVGFYDGRTDGRTEGRTDGQR